MELKLDELPLPMSIIPDVALDDDALLRFCATNDFLRIERKRTGELRIMSPAGSESGERNAEVTGQLRNWSRADGRGVSFDSSAGFTLPDGSMLNPDAAWIERRRWLALSARDRKRFAPICPEFVIELRSESDNLRELQAKMEQWVANGAQVAWLIDPLERAVTVFRPGNAPDTFVNPSTVQGTGPVAGFELVMSWVWGDGSEVS